MSERNIYDPQTGLELQIGDRMPDGTRYAGWSRGTGKPMFTTPADAPLQMTFDEAAEYAAKLDAHGHRDWRIPSKVELDVLFNNRAAIGGFDMTGYPPDGWYRSSESQNDLKAWAERLRDGYQLDLGKDDRYSVRCVRSGQVQSCRPPK